MNAANLLKHFSRVSEASDAVSNLRAFVLELAMRGKLVEGHPDLEQVNDNYFNEPPADSLPANWRLLNFGKFCDIQGGNQPPKSQFIDEPRDGYIRLFQIRDLGDNPVPTYIPIETTNRFCKTGEILIGRYGASVGKVFWAQDGSYNVALAKFLYPQDAFIPQFAYLALKSHLFQNKLAGATRSAQAGFNKGDLADINFPLPPLAEQERIVAKVNELNGLCQCLADARTTREAQRDRFVAATYYHLNTNVGGEHHDRYARFFIDQIPHLTARPASIQQARRTILNLAVRGMLVPQHPSDEPASTLLDRTKKNRRVFWERSQLSAFAASHKNPPKEWRHRYVTPPSEVGLFDVPATWTWASALEVCERVENGNTPPSTDMFQGGGEVPFIKVYNLTKTGALDFTIKPTYISRKTHETLLARSKVLPGDVLMNIVGPPLGKVSVVPSDFPEWNTNQAVVLFRPSPAIRTRYLALCLLADSVMVWITRTAQATVGQSNITVSNSRLLPIPLPPLAEQERIITKVDELMAVCDALEEQLRTTEVECHNLLHAVLHEAETELALTEEARSVMYGGEIFGPSAHSDERLTV